MTIRKKFASFSVATGTVLALTVAFSGPVSAKDVTVEAPADRLTENVSFADLDLASPAEARLLTVRVGSAVRRVCAPFDQRHTFGEYGSCRSFAWNGARPQMKRAIARAQQIASTGLSSVAPVAIVIAAPQN